MKNMKIIISILCCISLIGAGIRIYMVNLWAEKPVIEYYPMGEFVDLGDNYFYYSNESMKGYQVKVNGAKVLTYSEYLEAHNLTEENIPTQSGVRRPAYVYDLDLTIRKTVDTELNYEGINLYSTRLNTANDSFQIHDDLFGALYPHLYLESGFALRPNSEMQMYFPYVALSLWEFHYDIESIKNQVFQLRLCNYPITKMITINPSI